jgi:membrane protein DedA with SNARE-associated domain
MRKRDGTTAAHTADMGSVHRQARRIAEVIQQRERGFDPSDPQRLASTVNSVVAEDSHVRESLFLDMEARTAADAQRLKRIALSAFAISALVGMMTAILLHTGVPSTSSSTSPTPVAGMSGLEATLFNIVQNWYLTFGYAGIILAMTLESCCIPLPSEIVMPLAGLFVYSHPAQFSLLGVTLAGAVGCLVGSSIAYVIGAAGGRPLLLKYGRYILISKADSDRADRWFARYGAPIAFFSRLLPVVRTYISLPAGIAETPIVPFLAFTLLGSLPWTFVLALVGYRLGPQLMSETSQLGTIFHGLDVVIIVLFLAAVAYYVYHHIKRDREARTLGAIQRDRIRS